MLQLWGGKQQLLPFAGETYAENTDTRPDSETTQREALSQTPAVGLSVCSV